ncbi:MAG: hypothetical protein QOG23_3154 [Blastocatellia bacterium]|jgi:hypothetical protein|nr:hypothetical protein [Blastocatellia bacterium]
MKMGIFWLCALILSFGGCHGRLTSSEKPSVRPTESDLIGIYRLDEKTLKMMRDEGGYTNILETKLVLRPDGTADITNMPDWWGRFGGSNKGYFSGPGKWKIDRDIGTGNWVIFLYMPNVYQALELIGRKSPYQIFTYVGDPDSGASMTFLKADDSLP